MTDPSSEPASSPPTSVLVEACVTTPGEAAAAVAAGARRLELCRDLGVGGLTPPVELVRRVVAEVTAPVMVMVRPEAGPYRADAARLGAMVEEVAALKDAGAAGVVLGILDDRGRIDRPALDALMAAAGGLPVTFHRAFDELTDLVDGLEVLAEAGVARVLTAGGSGTAWRGRRRLRDLVQVSAGRVGVLAGGRVRADHAVALVAATGVEEVHARAEAIPALVGALAAGQEGG